MPDKVDFMLSIGKDGQYSEIITSSYRVPQYKSNVEEAYERPEEKAEFDRVELSGLRYPFSINFEKSSNSSENLRSFLNILTGWRLPLMFPALDVQPKRRVRLWNTKKLPADVLCFQKDRERRVVMRRKSPQNNHTIAWLSATLMGVHIRSEDEALDLNVIDRREGKALELATVTAVDSKHEDASNKTKYWTITVASGSGALYQALNVSSDFPCT